ncbi:MAG: contractile injection system protein, VgrG/Pvc8 family [Bosea sp. (in: a-proteobacteria)]|nr:contractile injection system protein, VgrG/Pvc8 family [Bosea sp. (in: a-proteobacteria)]
MAFALSQPNALGYTPVISIEVNGREVAAGFYGRLIKATLTDQAGQESDKITFDLDDADNAIVVPPPKATIVVKLGYKETGLVPKGTFELQPIAFKGDADAGETLTIQASAADLKRKLKGKGRESFSNKSVKEIADTIAGRNGMTAHVDPAIANHKFDFRARVDVSEIDFLTTLCDELDAVVKPMGDKLVISQKGAAKSVSGLALPVIRIEKWDCADWEVTPDGRVEYGSVKAAWIDQKTGKRELAEAKTGLEGPETVLRSPYPTKEQAEKAAMAEARRLTRRSGSGNFKLYGRPDAQAEADVIAGESFRKEIAGAWRADSVEHAFESSGFTTTVNIAAKEDGSSSKEKD